MSELAVRVLRAAGAGLVAGLLTALVILIISAVLPGVTISASLWGTIVGLAVFLLTLFTGNSRL